MKSTSPSNLMFKGAFILTIAALLTKILSAFYRIPFQNIVGDVGFYIYQQIYPFYGAAVVLSTTGFPVVISKLYAEQKGENDGYKGLLLFSFLYLQILGFICFIILFLGADQIALWMKDPHLAVLLRVVSIVFLIIPSVSVLRGYYQGNGDMTPTALSQVGEQLTRVLTIIFLALLFTKKGYSLYMVGSGAMFGSITGSLFAVIILFTFVWIRKEWKVGSALGGQKAGYSKEVIKIFKVLTFQGLAICVSGMLMIFIQMADALNLYSLLISSGVGEGHAKSLKGIFDRGQPLIQMGTVAATSIGLSLVPLISSSRFKERKEWLQDKIKAALKISSVIAVGASAGLWAIIRPTNIMLFENDLGSPTLGILSFVILFSSVILTIIAIMQGMGELLFPASAIIFSFPLKYFLNLLLIPSFGTIGAAISTNLTLIIITVLLLYKFRKTIEFSLFPVHFFKVLLFAAIGMILFLKGYLYVTDKIIGVQIGEREKATFQALSSALLGGILYLFIIIRGKVFLEKDLDFLPMGDKLKHLMARKDRS